MVAMEATGGYERLAYGILWTQGLPVAVANPRSVRQFAMSMGYLEKTDRIDAGMIARYAAVKRLVAQPPAGATQRKLSAFVTRFRQMTEMQTMQKHQRRLVTEPVIVKQFAETLAMLKAQIDVLEENIMALIASDPLWADLNETFRAIKGVADRTVARLLAEMPEIGTLSGKAVAKLAGLAPLAKDSGKRQGNRSIRGGRTHVRSILVVIATGVRKHDPDFKAYHEKLTAAGKPKMVVRVAVARKLLVRLNAKARDARLKLANAA
jgi:transposase